MDRNKIVSIATSILIKNSINLQDIILLLDSYCIEKGKERKYIEGTTTSRYLLNRWC